MNEFWKSRTASERRLAMITLVLATISAAYLVAIPAIRNLAELDREIEQKEQDLITDTELAARSETVDAAFSKIAKEHSSKWSKQEIHDRLRQEIDRLAQQGPQGGPGPLVQIPIIPAGKLTEGGKDFREYQLTFKLQPAPISSVVEYLKRLHESPQALRIDGLELLRAPESGLVSAQIDVTRTVVNGVADAPAPKAAPAPQAAAEPAKDGNLARNPSFEQTPKKAGQIDDWDVQGCEVATSAEFATDGKVSLSATSAETGGAISQKQDLEGGATYEIQMAVMLKSGSGAEIGIADAAGKTMFDGALKVPADGTARSYQFRFVAPGAPGSKIALCAPFIKLPPGQKACILVDNVQLTKAQAQ